MKFLGGDPTSDNAAVAAAQLAADAITVASKKQYIVVGTEFPGGLGTVGELAVTDVLSTGTGTNAGGTYDAAAAIAAQLATDYATLGSQLGPGIVGILSLHPDDVAILNTWRSSNGQEDATTTNIDLSSNVLSGPLFFANLAALHDLNLVGYSGTIPPDVSTFSALTSLMLGSSGITTPPYISTHASLACLDLWGTAITTPPDLTYNVSLAYLDLGGCTQLTSPPDLTYNVALTALYLNGCTGLTTPPNVSSNVALVTVDLHGCTDMSSPPDVSLNVLLVYLDLSGCTSLDAADLETLLGYLMNSSVDAADVDLSGTVTPNAVTMGMIVAWCYATEGTMTITVPGTVTGSASGAKVAAQSYSYDASSGRYYGDIDGARLYHDGSNWVIGQGADTWVGDAVIMHGGSYPYVLAGEADIEIAVV